MMRERFMLVTGVLAALLLVAGSVEAQQRTLSMSGQWYQNRGPLVDIPINGGPRLCGGPIQTGCANGLQPANGGIPAVGAAVPASGSAPAAFSINTSNAFGQAGGAANRTTVPVAGIPTVIQLASQFSLMGPGLTTVGGGGGVGTFQSNAWSQDPVQIADGRLAAAFTWCPPGIATMTGTMATGTMFTGVPGACNLVTPTYGTVTTTTNGALGLKFTYSGGGNAFGGTMSMMLRDTAVVSINNGGAVLHQLVGGTTNPTFAPQMGGGGYPASRALTLAAGPQHSTFMTSTPCTSGVGMEPAPPGCGVITAQGAQTVTLPGSMNFDWGMPWTTGMIMVQAQAGPVPTQDPPTFFTVTGSDSRTPLGKGQITMVAGQLTERRPSSNSFAALDILVMNFDAPETPLLSGPALMAMAALMLLAGGYMARRHFATDTVA